MQSVLAALNIEHGDAGKEMSESEKKANLEELSKKSKRRVHYQKFVRSGILSCQYSNNLTVILIIGGKTPITTQWRTWDVFWALSPRR